MTLVFQRVDDSARSQAAVGALAQHLNAIGSGSPAEFLTEIRRRGVLVASDGSKLRIECSTCGATRDVEPGHLGWVHFCDLCGHRFAERDNPWTRWVTPTEFKRGGAPFDQSTGRLRQLDLVAELPLGDRVHQIPRSGDCRFLVSRLTEPRLTVRVRNRGRLPIPAGYLTFQGAGRGTAGPRPLLGHDETHTVSVPVPRDAGESELEVCFEVPSVGRRRVARCVLEPLGSISWARHVPTGSDSQGAEPSGPMQTSRFGIEIGFAGRAPSLSRARGQLRLPDQVWPLRCRPTDDTAGRHIWTTALGVVLKAGATFEVVLDYDRVIGPIRLRGTFDDRRQVSVSHPPLHPTQAMTASDRTTNRLRQPGTGGRPRTMPSRSLGWGIPLVLDTGPAGIVAGCADGQGSVLRAPIAVPDSIGRVAEALQGLDPLGLDARSIAASAEEDALDVSGIIALTDHAWQPLAPAGPSPNDELVQRGRAVVESLEDARPGHLDQIALLYSPVTTTERIRQMRQALAHIAPEARAYLDIDRATALAIDTLEREVGAFVERGRPLRLLVVDVGPAQTTVSEHELRPLDATPGPGGRSRPALRATTAAAVAIHCGVLDIVDEVGLGTVEPILADEPADDGPAGSIDTMVEDGLWLFSQTDRQRWLDQSADITAKDEAPAEPPPARRAEETMRDGLPSAGRRLSLRLLTGALLMRLTTTKEATITSVDGAGPWVRRWCEEIRRDPTRVVDVSEPEAITRCSLRGTMARRSLKPLIEALLRPARMVIESFVRGTDRGASLIVAHAPGLIGEVLRDQLMQWSRGGTSHGAEVHLARTENAPALRGALLYYEIKRLGALAVDITLPEPIDSLSVAVECLTPAHRTLVPVGCPLPLAVGYQAITHPACILLFRGWFESSTDGIRIPVSLDALEYRDDERFEDLLERHRDSERLALKLRVRCRADSEEAQVVCEVVELTGGTAHDLMGEIERQRQRYRAADTHPQISVQMPPGVSERVLTRWPVAVPRYPGVVVAAPVDLRAATPA